MGQRLKLRRQIVSNGRYMQNQARRATTSLLGQFMGGMGFVCVLVAIGTCFSFVSGLKSGEGVNAVPSLIESIVAALAAFFLFKMCSDLIEVAAETDPGIPLNLVNPANLPAQDSLVRASSAPVQEQQAVLLRAAGTCEQTPAELLVRPSGEGRELP